MLNARRGILASTWAPPLRSPERVDRIGVLICFENESGVHKIGLECCYCTMYLISLSTVHSNNTTL